MSLSSQKKCRLRFIITERTIGKRIYIKVPLSLLVDIGSLLYALLSVLHPDWLIRSNFRLSRSDNCIKILTKTPRVEKAYKRKKNISN